MTSINLTLNSQHQRGIGLVEVMVALLLLGVAVLGYTALQARSLGTTDEAIVRTQGQTLLRNFAERIRTTGTTEDILTKYQTQLGAVTSSATCNDSSTIDDCIAADINALKTQAQQDGIKLGMVTCPGTAATTANTRCLIAAWKETTPTMGTATTDCMDATGVYKFNADCVYMEAY